MSIADDDTLKLQEINLTNEEILNQRFDEGMNVLNLSIDSQRINIIKYLATKLSQ
jgi:hypothetical protein